MDANRAGHVDDDAGAGADDRRRRVDCVVKVIVASPKSMAALESTLATVSAALPANRS